MLTKKDISFPGTDWRLIEQTQVGEEPERRLALGRLLTQYTAAMKVYVRARWQISADDADDLLQSFICDKFVLGSLLRGFSRDRGRFRSYLLVSLDHYAISHFRRLATEKRALPHLADLAEEELEVESERRANAQRLFDVAWAELLIRECLGRMEQHCNSIGRQILWRAFSARIVQPILSGEQCKPPSFRDLAAELGLGSPVQASNLVITGRRMFQRQWKQLIDEYAGSDCDVEELRALSASLKAMEQAPPDP
jgi:DNA-directed RNA polymerase specialized sigma24 family protein